MVGSTWTFGTQFFQLAFFNRNDVLHQTDDISEGIGKFRPHGLLSVKAHQTHLKFGEIQLKCIRNRCVHNPFLIRSYHKFAIAGLPSWRLALCLLGAWLVVFAIISRGVKSSGKASYFLALFPYVIMLALLIRAVTLEGASKGILFFLTPQWHELKNPKVLFAHSSQQHLLARMARFPSN